MTTSPLPPAGVAPMEPERLARLKNLLFAQREAVEACRRAAGTQLYGLRCGEREIADSDVASAARHELEPLLSIAEDHARLVEECGRLRRVVSEIAEYDEDLGGSPHADALRDIARRALQPKAPRQ